MATYASGRYRPVTLMRTGAATPEWIIPASPEHWAAVRRGIYGVVNDPTGTAYAYARFVDDRFALCGKTGSATAHPWPTSYRVTYADDTGAEKVAVVRAGAKAPAITRFTAEHPLATFDRDAVEVATKWPPHPPPDGERYAHAWFAGYLQKLDEGGQPDWSAAPRIAFAVLVEFGGSGGRTSGVLAKRVAAELVDILGPELNVETVTMSDG
jgi:cell division protein FtsI/penicillin-binding protein 2